MATLPPPTTPILVVDDSPAIRALMESYLKRLGFSNVRTASNVETALQAFHEQESDVVFVDVMLDRETGNAFATKALGERPFATLVVTTALPGDNDLVTDLVSHGARHFLSKPIQLSALRTVLAKIEDARRDETQIPQPSPYNSAEATRGYQ